MRSAPFALSQVLRAIAGVTIALALGGCQTMLYLRTQLVFKHDLTALTVTEHFDIRYRPGGKASQHAPRLAGEAEQALARICARLEVTNDTRFALFLFDDLGDLAKTSHTNDKGGYAAGGTAVAVYDDDAGTFHELVHLVTYAKVARPRNDAGLLIEGLAQAMFDATPACDVHAVAKYYRGRKRLPRLATMTGSGFYDRLKEYSQFNAYDVAGSWMRFLLESHGVAATRRYYASRNPQQAFGRSLVDLEAAWHAMLDRYTPPAETWAHLARVDAKPIHLRFTRIAGESFAMKSETGPISIAVPHPPITFRYRWLKNGEATEHGGPIASQAPTPTPIEWAKLTPQDSGIYSLTILAEHEGQTGTAGTVFSFILNVIPASVVSRAEASPSRPADATEKSDQT